MAPSYNDIVDPTDVNPITYAKLPKLVDRWRKNNEPMTDRLMMLLCMWVKKMEASHYHRKQRNNDAKLTRRVDRVLYFLECVKQHPEKDVEWLMSVFRCRFPMLEVYLQVKSWQLEVASERTDLLHRLCAPELKHLQVVLSVIQKMNDEGLSMTYENALKVWTPLRTKANKGRPPGKIAQENFRKQWLYYWRVFLTRKDIVKCEPTGASAFVAK